MSLNQDEIEMINTEFEALPAEKRIEWAWDRFGAGLILSTSFGLQSSVMLDLVLKISDEIPVVFVDTGYLLTENYQYALTLQERIGFRVKTYSAKMSPSFQEATFGKLWEQGADEMKRYNFLNKKEPMQWAISELGATAWLSGLRRAQSSDRGKRLLLKGRMILLKYILFLIGMTGRPISIYRRIICPIIHRKVWDITRLETTKALRRLILTDPLKIPGTVGMGANVDYIWICLKVLTFQSNANPIVYDFARR